MDARRIISVGFLGVLLLAGTEDARGAGDGAAGRPAQMGPAGLRSVELSGPAGAGTAVKGLTLADGSGLALASPLPLFTVLVDGRPTPASTLPAGLALAVTHVSGFGPGAKLNVVFRNDSKSKITLENLVPLGEGADRVYITAGLPNEEPHTLDRTQLFRPGLAPVGVVVPDNAWAMGFASLDLAGGRTLSAIARRVKTDKAERTRWAVTLAPGGSVEYALYFEAHRGGWRRGLEIMFRERYLYDLEKFDEALFERADLAWVRRAYLMVLRFAWDRSYYDREAGYTFDRTLTAWDRTLGPVDIFTIWPTWPRLGLDSRNQWDMYRDLPGGLEELRRQVDLAHSLGKKYFMSYNPWDESTRHEDHIAGMERMLRTLDADGVVLDTRGESSREFQDAADRVKPGIIMYSEGMAVPRDMPGIVSGRVHDALYMPPPLNMNKYMRPDFAIFRVLQLAEGPLHREAAVAFFNGYGSEINTMRPGRPDWIDEDLRYLGRTTKLLRENSSAFLDRHWEPLAAALEDGLWANRWRDGAKTVFTVYSLRPEGFKGPFVEVEIPAGAHLVSLWNHQELEPVVRDGRTYAPVDVAAFDAGGARDAPRGERRLRRRPAHASEGRCRRRARDLRGARRAGRKPDRDLRREPVLRGGRGLVRDGKAHRRPPRAPRLPRGEVRRPALRRARRDPRRARRPAAPGLPAPRDAGRANGCGLEGARPAWSRSRPGRSSSRRPAIPTTPIRSSRIPTPKSRERSSCAGSSWTGRR